MPYIPVIDQTACLAHGDCEELAPEVFHVGDTGEVIGAAPAEVLVRAAEGCPAGAISVVDGETGEQLYP